MLGSVKLQLHSCDLRDAQSIALSTSHWRTGEVAFSFVGVSMVLLKNQWK
jgi:hypothetical protein